MLTEQDRTARLIDAAEKYAEHYDDTEKTDVLNAFFRGSEFERSPNKDGQIIIESLRPMSEAKGDVTSHQILIYFDSNNPNIDDVYAEASDFNHAIDNWNYTRVKGYSVIGWASLPIYKPKKVDE